MAWLTFIYVWPPFTHTSASDWYSVDKHLIGYSRWVETIRGRIFAVRALERPIPLPLGSYTDRGELGRQRGLQRALAPYGPISVRTHAHARARDSTYRGDCREALYVLCIMCLDTTGVSKSTVSVAGCSVSIWRGELVPPTGTYRRRCREKVPIRYIMTIWYVGDLHTGGFLSRAF